MHVCVYVYVCVSVYVRFVKHFVVCVLYEMYMSILSEVLIDTSLCMKSKSEVLRCMHTGSYYRTVYFLGG